MANYIIIGGDNKEYGPVSDADVRAWIAEGRLNGESRMKAESDAEFRALALFPEFAALLGGRANPPTIDPVTSAPARTPEDFLNRDYELDIGGCLSRGWEVYKENFGLVFGAFIVAALVYMGCAGVLDVVIMPFSKAILHAPAGVQVAFNYLFSGIISLVMGPLMGGLYSVYLKTIRKQPASVGEVFSGFQLAYRQLVLGQLTVWVAVGACTLPFSFVWQSKAAPLLLQMQDMKSDPAAMQEIMPKLMSAGTSSMPLLLVCMVPVIFLTVSWLFTIPLIIDKQMTFGAAMKTSWIMVMKHWWQMFGLVVVASLAGFCGIVGCCIGVLFTFPIGLMATMFAYETVFGDQRD